MSSGCQPLSVSAEAPDRLGNIPDDCQEKIRQIVDYWLSIHPPSGLPGRQHFDPLDIPYLLPNLRLQDIVGDPPRIRMRLMGTRILEFFGQEHTGKWFDETFDDFENSSTFQDFLSVVQTKRPNWRRGPPALVYGKEFVTLERVHLPLAADGESVDMVVTCMVFGDSEGRFV